MAGKNYYIACGYTDMRKQIDGLVALVEMETGKRIEEETVYLFCGRRADRIKCYCSRSLSQNCSIGLT
jgi:transposase